MKSGFWHELFLQWATNANNVIITSRLSLETLARDWIANGGNGRKFELDMKKQRNLK